MLINKTTGEIAYHSLVWDKEGVLRQIQYELKDKNGEIEYLGPETVRLLTNK